jgi:hypothetical protein
MKTAMRHSVPKMFTTLAFVGAIALITSSASAQSLSTPEGTWKIDANGHKGTLNITSVSGISVSGNMNFAGSIQQITGIWESAAQKLTFLRIPASAAPRDYQSYTGYVFPVQTGTTANGFSMGGHFEAFPGTAGNRASHGWTAVKCGTSNPSCVLP